MKGYFIAKSTTTGPYAMYQQLGCEGGWAGAGFGWCCYWELFCWCVSCIQASSILSHCCWSRHRAWLRVHWKWVPSIFSTAIILTITGLKSAQKARKNGNKTLCMSSLVHSTLQFLQELLKNSKVAINPWGQALMTFLSKTKLFAAQSLHR